ncbi:hypothetical protein [Azonexus sp. R2A61]|uniref:hypothetical protein n=1 Tax=Azonexus sp. R2A61 TaxID=2744443 RepID=UPI001F1E6613|nr:hypothetical protein [Azonexus sp. R2A61]
MTESKTKPAVKSAAKPAATAKAPLKPRVAPKPAEPVAATPATKAATARVRKPSAVDRTVARHQKELADALVKAEAIQYDKPTKPAKAAKPEKAEKTVKTKKAKLVRDSYAMPETEYARIAELKKRLAALGSEVKKSELLRGGIAVLAALNDAELQAVMARVERIKTGRPSKKA